MVEAGQLTTDQKGSIAEACIAAAAIKLGIGVYRPLSDGARYDLIFDVGDRLRRVQCKWASRIGDAVAIRCYSNRRAREGLRRRRYTAAEIDLVAAYCLELDRCFVVPVARVAGHNEVWLRLAPTRNNQRRAINWADEFALESLQSQMTLGP